MTMFSEKERIVAAIVLFKTVGIAPLSTHLKSTYFKYRFDIENNDGLV